jgi:tRNA (cytidine/uridine-2'-O-)-methyltransferase
MYIVLYEPEIPPNTGNIIRLCANTGVSLHLVEPLGFTLETKALRRAGLDYRDSAAVQTHASLSDCLEKLKSTQSEARVFAVSTKGEHQYHQQTYAAGDILIFGPESRGLPDSVLYDTDIWRRIRVPMKPNSRSINLSNTVAIITFEILRQVGFPDLI